MFIATRGRGKGQWWPVKDTEGRLSAELYCDKCGLPSHMLNHTIAADGVVSPSFVECADQERCGTFHQFVKLEGWNVN